jgi:dual specificity tyrosine-phosphorylation-regulated kinase 1
MSTAQAMDLDEPMHHVQHSVASRFSQQPPSSSASHNHAPGSSVSRDPSPVNTFRDPAERPLMKLSVKLLTTYRHINDVYYAKQRKSHMQDALTTGSTQRVTVTNEGYDDEEGNYIVHRGEEILQRYIVTRILGRGSFGVVVEARDMLRSENVALKIIRNKRQFTQQAKLEIRLLRLLNEKDAFDRHFIVRLKKYFEWRQHLVLVFELCSMNLYDLLKHTNFHGFSLHLIRKFAYQILNCLAYLAQPDIRIIHCDLKPENVLLRNPRYVSGISMAFLIGLVYFLFIVSCYANCIFVVVHM